MIIKHLQYELFEEGDGNRLVYFGAFDAEAERAHSDRITSLEAADATNLTGGEIEKLTEGINELKWQIYELTQLLIEGRSEDGSTPRRDPITDNRGYDDDDAGHLAPAVVFANAASEPINNATDFVEQLTAYRTAFDNIKAMTFKEPISEWVLEDDDGNPIDKSNEIPEIGLWNFSDILADGTVTAKAGDTAGATMSLYNEHGLQLQIPAGGTFEVRKNEPLRYGLSDGESATDDGYLIPISYGGQDLYVNTNDLELPAHGITAERTDSGFRYTRAADTSTGPVAIDLTLLSTGEADNLLPDGGTTWENLITLARNYEMAKEVSPRAYARKLFDEGAKKLLGTPSVGNMQSALAYSDEAYFADNAYADAWYLDAWARMELIKAGDTGNTIQDVKDAIQAYESADDTSKTSGDGIARLREEVRRYELMDEEDIPLHDTDTGALLGDNLYSSSLRGEIPSLQRAAVADAASQEDIEKYAQKRLELKKVMGIERRLANEYLFEGDNQWTEDLLELYFDIQANYSTNLSAFLMEQLTKEGGALEDFSSDRYLVYSSIEPLKGLVSELVTAQIEHRIDFSEGVVSGVEFEKKDLPDATAVARQLFIKDSTTFDDLDVNEDGVLILSLQGTVYAIEKGAEEGKTRGLTISYIGKDGRKRIREIFKAPAGVLTMIADNIEVGKGEDGKEARELKAGLIAAAGLPDMQLPAVKLAAGSKQRDTTELVSTLTDASRASRASASAEGDAAEGTSTATGTGTTGDGDADTVAEEAGGGELAGDETTAETGESTAAEGGATATGGGEELPEEPGSTEEGTDGSGEHGTEDEEAPPERDFLDRPKPIEIKPEMTDVERGKTVENNTVAMNKYRIEKLVYRGHVYKKGEENPPMVKVFAKSRVKDLMDFYKQVEAMRYGGSDRRTHKGSWNAKFRGLLEGAKVKVSKSGDIHLIGRPLILYNTIRRAIEEGDRNNVPVDYDSPYSGDEWLDAMADRQYEISHKGASDLEPKDVPQVHPAHPDRIESPEALTVDIRKMKIGEEYGYRVHVTDGGRDTPYVFKVKRTRTGYEIDYGDGQPAHFVNGGEVGDKFVDGILMDKLGEGRKGTWTDFHAFRVKEGELSHERLEELHREFMENITLEESEARVERRTELLLKEISKESKLPLPRVRKLFEKRHSKLVAQVADIYIAGDQTGPRKRALDEKEYAAAMLYLKKMGYKFGKKKSDGKTPDFSAGSVPKEDSNPAIDHLRNMVREDIEDEGTADADDLIPEEEESGRLAGKETDKPAPAHRASVMEKLAALGVPPKLARRAKRIHKQFIDHLWANSGEITIRRMDYIRFGFPAKEYESRMGNRLAIAEFAKMRRQIEGRRTSGGKRTGGLRDDLFDNEVDTRNLPLFTSDNTVDDALLRMAAITALAETQELENSVAYVMGDCNRAGPKIADRGEGYASPRVRRSVYRPYV